LPAGGTTGQALVKASGTDYDVQWADIAIDVQYHQRYDTEAAALRSGATETVELYYTAQADGDGLSESASSDTPSAGNVIRRKLYYAEKAQANPDTSADWTQFTAIADNTTYANAKAALLAYLKERTGGTVPISLKMTWEEVSQSAYLLDQSYGSGAEAAYSTRQLRNAATDCMVIRRASDSTTQTIGFDGSGNIDESAIETFCTGTTCTVVTWKDQSGNGNDATAASTGEEPTIYTGGELVKESGRVAVEFTSTTQKLQSSSASAFTGVLQNELYIVGSYDVLNAGNQYAAGVQIGTAGRGVMAGTHSANEEIRYHCDGVTFEATNGGVIAVGERILHGGTYDGTTRHARLNGASVATNTDAGNTGTGTAYFIGKHPSLTAGGAKRVQESIIYAAYGGNESQIEENIGDYFTQNTPLLDTYSGAAAAYSLRLLDSTYTGALVNVWNGTSYADIYPNVFGELDTVALAAHCGSNDGFIRYWYDQSGNTNTAAQTTTANMPKIYDGTTGVVTENGLAAMTITNGQGFTLSSGIGASTNKYAFIVHAVDSADTSWSFFGDSTAVEVIPLAQDGNTGTSLASAGFLPINAIYKDGSALSVTTRDDLHAAYTSAGQSLTVMDFEGSAGIGIMFNRGGGRDYSGTAQAVIIYDADKSANRTNIEDNINTFYSIY